MSKKPRAPMFNHVAMSMPADSLDEAGRKAICDFYGEVFGWEELPTLTEDRKRLVLSCYTYEQFVFLIADEAPMRCPGGDHFGLSVRTPDELDAILERARKYRERDSRVVIDDKVIEDYQVLKLHSFYVGYRLPMKVEVQCYAWAEGLGPQSMPRSS